VAPALARDRSNSTASIQRYLSIVAVGGTVLLMAVALAGANAADRDPYVTRLFLALAAVGWGLLIAAFPFQLWLIPLCREGNRLAVAVLLTMTRPLGMAVLLGTFVTLPWATADSKLLEPLLWGGAVAAVAAALLALAEENELGRLSYLAVADVGVMLAGVATATPPGYAGVALALVSHALALALLVAGSVLWEKQRDSAARGWRWAGLCGIGIGVLALIGAPPASGFPGRWLIYEAVWAVNQGAAVALFGGALLMAIGALRLGRQLVVAGSARTDGATAPAGAMAWLAAGVVTGGALVLAIGVYPAPLVETVVAAINGLEGMAPW
jgi:formate hydrogenlyase subunit 3/multisubunit Na+/H+ antiporter MnhD subunit